MTSKERVKMAFAHKEPDRVPMFEVHINAQPAEEILGHYAPTGYGGYINGVLKNKMIEEGKLDQWHKDDMDIRIELCRKLDLDIVRTFPYAKNPPIPKMIKKNTWKVESPSGNWSIYRYSPEGDSYCEIDSNICQGSYEEIGKISSRIDEAGASLDGVSFSNIEYIKEKAPDLCTMGWADVPFYHNGWMAMFLEGLVFEPDIIEHWIRANMKQIMLNLKQQLEMGVDIVMGGQDFCDTHGPMFSPPCYDRFFKPYLLEITDLCHQYDVPYLRHNDGNLGLLEEPFLLHSGIDAWHAIEPAAGMDINYFKDKYGEAVTLAGNIDCASTLETGTPEEIREEVKQRIKKCAPGGGYLLASSNGVHNGISGENYITMIEAAREFGKYPIKIEN